MRRVNLPVRAPLDFPSEARTAEFVLGDVVAGVEVVLGCESEWVEVADGDGAGFEDKGSLTSRIRGRGVGGDGGGVGKGGAGAASEKCGDEQWCQGIGAQCVPPFFKVFLHNLVHFTRL